MRRSGIVVLDSIVVEKLKEINIYLDLESNEFNNTYKAV